MTPDDLVTKQVALDGAERSLMSRLATIQAQKKALKPGQNTEGYPTPADVSKKAVKRENVKPAEQSEKEVAEGMKSPQDPSWDMVEMSAPSTPQQ